MRGEIDMTRRGFFRPRLSSPRRDRAGEHDSAATARIEQFRLVMLPHMDAAYSFAVYLARNPTLAEDIVQEAFLRALRGFDGWHGDNPKAWLFSIVRNCHLDGVRKRRDPLRDAEDVESIDDGAPALVDDDALEDRAARNSDAAMLRLTIENLPEPFRETLVLRELEELSYKEIAGITQVRLGTVMSRLARARAMLAELLLPPCGGEAWEARS
jgi:RNA polymerase sigma-70 factor (ECF subfamily)